ADEVRIVDAKTYQFIRSCKTFGTDNPSFIFSPDSKNFALSNTWDNWEKPATGGIRVLDMVGMEIDKNKFLPTSGAFEHSLAYSPDGTQLIAYFGNRLRIWNTNGFSIKYDSILSDAGGEVAYCPTGKCFAT